MSVSKVFAPLNESVPVAKSTKMDENTATINGKPHKSIPKLPGYVPEIYIVDEGRVIGLYSHVL